ncbi:hypothetical protein NBRC3257_0944 [Gluconobacter thailandicus NBRC 3257]|uniref:Uncharacterized protein n=1 Tax=Gluconobacter thailandicus NBRC 3257 TaxID=1381097 RepID=A0ABQ0IUR2_GLUTH|nr:hypothetical protein B932_1514 [Gluconobacter oxydans H24]GAD25945.1 hypothetical protein NBRC3257_0944 [Gluconobacter thailandicus NBRC 3257]
MLAEGWWLLTDPYAGFSVSLVVPPCMGGIAVLQAGHDVHEQPIFIQAASRPRRSARPDRLCRPGAGG